MLLVFFIQEKNSFFYLSYGNNAQIGFWLNESLCPLIELIAPLGWRLSHFTDHVGVQ